jgi:hypothetical protein
VEVINKGRWFGQETPEINKKSKSPVLFLEWAAKVIK